MTDQERKAMEMALEALEDSMYPQKKQFDAIVGLKQALAQPEQAHTDHPMRHWDRTCPACAAEREQCAKHYLAIMRDAVEQAVLREREACAKVADEMSEDVMRFECWQTHALELCGEAIRARGDKHD